MRSVSLATLRSRVALRFNLPTVDATSWVTTTELNAEINASLQQFYALWMDGQGDDYFAAYEDVATSANVDLTSLPDGCFRVLNVTWLRATDDPVQMEQAHPREARLSGLEPQSWDSVRPRWAPHGTSSIRWLPTPSAEYSLRVTYVKLPADLNDSEETATFDGGPGWEEWVINDVCEKLCPRDERDPSGFTAAKDAIEARIRDQAPQRGDVSGGLLLDRTPRPGTMGDWEYRNWLSRNGGWG